jgi:phenylalanine ammonia-lyase
MNVVSFQETTTVAKQFNQKQASNDAVVIGNAPLTLDDVINVARHGKQVSLTTQKKILQGLEASCDYIADLWCH